ncbi:unnamed protein product [Trypanosoma congolense IL3000]|uniref:WGS project CAEQ00000000 data, annotated contig 578 n=1 Tax=Trypanosoma congolense (strain IL3000) TaxID=1068625 RepID=F9WGZ8_TRYCI|nr:unnamed protein product [Trypanosoma congolense IL3000]
MEMKAGSVWWVMVWVLISFPVTSRAWDPSRKAIPTEVGESICSLSRKLKDVSPWTQEKIATLRRTRDAYASKLLDWKLHFHGSLECEVNESILGEIWAALEKVSEELSGLHTKAIRAGALAAKSAGRLDEFITVFANAQKNSFIDKVNYCLGSKGDPAKKRDLLDCFPYGDKLEIDEANLGKIPEITTDDNGPDLVAVIKKLNHSSVALYMKRVSMIDAHADCNLIKGTGGGILSGALNDKLWWGGGILTIGKCFDGEIKVSQFGPGEVADTKHSTANWTASPHTIPHLRKTLTAFQDFKEAAAKITKKISEIEKIEKKIEPCLSNETMEEGPTQSCFRNAIKLNSELQAVNALLARYQKEKGPLPSGSTLILHQSLLNVCFYFAFLL